MPGDPVLIAYGVKQSSKTKRNIWCRIGEAFPHEEGAGLTVVLNALPPDGRVILLEPDAADEHPAQLLIELGGVAGAVGIAALYRGLALGSAATVAPTAAVITAVFPVIVGAMTGGLPSVWQGAGFLVAMAGIWLVAGSGSGAEQSGSALRLAVVAGLGFGGFLVLVARVQADTVFLPLAVARSVTFITALAILRARGVVLPAPGAHPVALLAGALDTGGNVLFLLARQHTRVDIASVLSSFYPVATVALARLLLGEPVTRTQWIGAAACLIAVGLISL